MKDWRESMGKAKEIKAKKLVREFGICKKPRKWKAIRIYGDRDKVQVVEV